MFVHIIVPSIAAARVGSLSDAGMSGGAAEEYISKCHCAGRKHACAGEGEGTDKQAH